MMQKMNLSDLIPVIDETFSRGKGFRLPITGTSMNPLLYQSRDFVIIEKPNLPLSVGDIPLYRRNDGSFVLHRVVKIKENGEYVMCGDNQFILESGITDKNIIGVVKTIIRDGREFSVDTDEWYLAHKSKYIKNINTRYPIRRLRYFLSRKLKHKNAPVGQIADKEKINRDIIETGEILIGAITSEIKNRHFDFPENTDFKKIYNLAQAHRVAPIVASAVLKSENAPDDIKKLFKGAAFKNAVRYSAQEKENNEISAEFSKNGIKHCFLKGTKVAKFYDNPDLRFMLDADLYVKYEDFDKAEKILLDRGYEINSFGDEKDTGYTKKPLFNIELHKELKYDYDKGYDYYKGAFARMTASDGYALNMTNEDFYVYILSHTAHHFEVAGTGLKSIIDHYYLKTKLKPECDERLLAEGLEKTGLSDFSDKMDALCDYWFEKTEVDNYIKEMSDYVILSGVFGNSTNEYLSGIVRGNYGEKKSDYFASRLFPNIEKMSPKYPILKKAPFLLPFFWVIRLFGSLFSARRIVGEAKSINSTDTSKAQQQADFLNNIGL